MELSECRESIVGEAEPPRKPKDLRSNKRGDCLEVRNHKLIAL